MKAIVTDYDYTLSDKFMTVEFLHLLEEKGLIQGYKKEYETLRGDYNKGRKSYNDFVSGDMSLMQKHIKNVKYLEVTKILRENFSPKNNLFDWSYKIRDIFVPDEWLFIVVSSTMDLCLEKTQDILGFDTYYCSSYEVKNEKFTGEFKCQVQSEEKGHYVKHLVRDLEKVVVVGDSPGDFKMMEHATKSYLFEPDASTLEEIGEQDFEIVNRDNVLDFLKKQV